MFMTYHNYKNVESSTIIRKPISQPASAGFRQHAFGAASLLLSRHAGQWSEACRARALYLSSRFPSLVKLAGIEHQSLLTTAIRSVGHANGH
jgi:hypothetical protein